MADNASPNRRDTAAWSSVTGARGAFFGRSDKLRGELYRGCQRVVLSADGRTLQREGASAQDAMLALDLATNVVRELRNKAPAAGQGSRAAGAVAAVERGDPSAWVDAAGRVQTFSLRCAAQHPLLVMRPTD